VTKPSVTTHAVKAAPLTYTELDTNFTNLRDATVTVQGGATSVVADLNGTVKLVAGDNVTITGDNNTKEITIAADGGGGDAFGTIAVSGQSPLVADSPNSVLNVSAGSGISLTTNPSTGTLTITNTGGTETMTLFGQDARMLYNLDLRGFVLKSDQARDGRPSGTVHINGSLNVVGTASNLTVGNHLFVKEIYSDPTNATQKSRIDLGNGTGSSNILSLFAGSGNGVIDLQGNLKFKSTTGTPTDTTTPAAWLNVTVGTTGYFLPLYQ